MNEDLIRLISESLNDYRRDMRKAGKSLEKKADVTRMTAIGLIGFVEGELKREIK